MLQRIGYAMLLKVLAEGPQYLRLLLQEVRQSQGICRLLPHSEGQGLETPLQQEAGVGV